MRRHGKRGDAVTRYSETRLLQMDVEAEERAALAAELHPFAGLTAREAARLVRCSVSAVEKTLTDMVERGEATRSDVFGLVVYYAPEVTP